ncbi:MAG: acyl carrier protein [Sphingomonas sp.]|uniref:acyl carrier protein n=1 Tax=Sphingomonas sp. TaxID=28214 RepID=UPI001AC4C7CA|nr:acyl carrier protein [Sphingomonas sp.]MBN8807693.1 acyl carrier protein [Sphingomonas sp.]
MTQPIQHTSRPQIADTDRIVRAVLRDVLALDQARVDGFDSATPLFGALPELDSMAVAGVLTEIEDRLGILIEDDEVDGAMLETFGALTAFAQAKVAARTRD